MKTTHTACVALIASAFVLATVLIVRLDATTPSNQAYADGQVISQPSFTLMTARTRGQAGSGEESLMVLDNRSGNVLVYGLKASQRKLIPLTSIATNQIFKIKSKNSDRDSDR